MTSTEVPGNLSIIRALSIQLQNRLTKGIKAYFNGMLRLLFSDPPLCAGWLIWWLSKAWLPPQISFLKLTGLHHAACSTAECSVAFGTCEPASRVGSPHRLIFNITLIPTFTAAGERGS